VGAFVAGLPEGRSECAAPAPGDALPMRDAFAVLFFVSVGMLCNPRSLLESPLLIAVVLVVVMIGKPVAALVVVRLSGRPLATALPVGAALGQIGEFSFILGVAARDLGLLTDAGWNALVGASILSIAANPTAYRFAREWASSAPALAPPAAEAPAVDPRRCILVGYGPVGQTVHRILAQYGTAVTVIELNLETVRRLREEGHATVYGDVLRAGTLEEAGIATAGTLILSAEVEDGAEIVRQARIANPRLRALARCSHLRDVPPLRRAGAIVIAGEAEVAAALAEIVMAGNEADPDTFARQRTEIRKSLYAASPAA
jgi:CPA2 family monovalent cation:H+ antiporter-2